MREIECVSLKKIGEGGGLSLYQYAPFTDCIYLFIYFFPRREKMCACVCVCVFE